MPNQVIRTGSHTYTTISVSSLVEHRARMLLSREAFRLYRAIRSGDIDHTDYRIDMILYDVTPKEWVEALTLAMEAGRG